MLRADLELLELVMRNRNAQRIYSPAPLLATPGRLFATMCSDLWQARTVVGLHDYEQYLADLYGKAWLHGHKHS